MTLLPVQDNKCYMCGGEKVQLTNHHCIPRHLKPKHNVTVPLCIECHKKITADDITGLYAYAYKLENQIGGLLKQVKGIRTAVENHVQIKVKK